MAKNTNAKAAQLEPVTLTSVEMMEVMETCIACPMDGYPGTPECLWGAPLLIEGEPGIAKTARIKQVAKGLDAPLFIFYAAPHPPESFAGALIPDGKGGATSIVALHELRNAIAAGTGIIFLDEINGAAPATQGALQSLVHERITGGVKLPGELRIIAAQNPEDVATGGFRLSPPVANRFLHRQDAGPSADEWVRWSAGGDNWESKYTLDTLETLVVSNWPTYWPEVQGLFAGFITRHPDLLHKRPDVSHPDSSRAWPSHRMWDVARRVWCTQRIMGRSDTVAQALVEGCVGIGASDAFITYASATKLPTPTELLNGQWQLDSDRLDIVVGAYAAATAYVTQRPTPKEQQDLAPKMWKALEKLFNAGMSDIVVPSVELLLKNKLGRNSGIKDIINAANPVLVAMNTSGLLKQKEDAEK